MLARTFGIASLSLGAAAIFVPSAFAQLNDGGGELAATLTVEELAGCTNRDTLGAAVGERMGRSPFVDGEPIDVQLAVSFRRRERAYHATLVLRTADGRTIGVRGLQGRPDASCTELDEPLALVLALALRSPATRDAVRETARPAAFFVGGIVRGALGLLPEPSFGAGIAAELDLPGFVPLRLELSGWLPQTHLAEGFRGRFAALDATFEACPRVWRAELFEWSLCGGLAAGMIRGEGQDLGFRRSEWRPLVDGALGTRVSVSLGVFRIDLGVHGTAALIRDRFTVLRLDGTPVLLYRRALVGARLTLGLQIRFL